MQRAVCLRVLSLSCRYGEVRFQLAGQDSEGEYVKMGLADYLWRGVPLYNPITGCHRLTSTCFHTLDLYMCNPAS